MASSCTGDGPQRTGESGYGRKGSSIHRTRFTSAGRTGRARRYVLGSAWQVSALFGSQRENSRAKQSTIREVVHMSENPYQSPSTEEGQRQSEPIAGRKVVLVVFFSLILLSFFMNLTVGLRLWFR